MRREKDKPIEQTYDVCDALILDFKKGELEKEQGFDVKVTLEDKEQGIQSDALDKAGDICLKELGGNRFSLVMVNYGWKGKSKCI